MAVNNKNDGVEKNMQKSYFDVLGICCSSEVPMIEKILKPLEGVMDVSVIVPSRTVIVLHDTLLISELQIVKVLNQARLEANVRRYGEGTNYRKKWPSPYAVICGVLLLLSFLKLVYKPFQWLAIAAVAVGIFPIILKAVASIRNFRLDINILMLIAVGGSIALKDYWEAATIVFLFTTAEWLESRACHKADAVMLSLVNLVPQRAVLAESGEEVNAADVKLNTLLAVKDGEVIPLDGIVVDGKCEVDERTLTGESFPVPKQIDSTVWAGTINLNGYITIKTTALAEDCVVARMANLVEEAQKNKSKAQRFIDRCTKYYTPAVVVIAICIAVVPAAIRAKNLDKWFHLALVVLVSGCPCALILSTPVATHCALSKAAKSGLLIKGAEYLETLAKVKIMCFDKTGTITRGEFEVTDFQPLVKDSNIETLLYWVSSIESKSSHPMAAALVDYANTHSVKPMPEKVKDFQNFPGEGIYGQIDGKDIYVGNKRIAARAGCSTVPTLEGYANEGKSIGYIFSGSSPAGVFSLSDVCRTGVKEAVKELKSMGIKTSMLTGDSQAAANSAQEQLDGGIEEVHAELLPEDKARIIKEFQKISPTAMIGDGLNDAAALATADIGISMGISGSALAMETGQIILLSNDIRKIPMAARLSRRTRRTIIENVILSIITKLGIIALALAGHPYVWAAVLADVGTCMVVICNSMLLLRGGGNLGKSSAHVHKHGSHKSCHECCSRTKVETKCKTQKCSSKECELEKNKCSSSAEKHGTCSHAHHPTHKLSASSSTAKNHGGCLHTVDKAKEENKHCCPSTKVDAECTKGKCTSKKSCKNTSSTKCLTSPDHKKNECYANSIEKIKEEKKQCCSKSSTSCKGNKTKSEKHVDHISEIHKHCEEHVNHSNHMNLEPIHHHQHGPEKAHQHCEEHETHSIQMDKDVDHHHHHHHHHQRPQEAHQHCEEHKNHRCDLSKDVVHHHDHEFVEPHKVHCGSNHCTREYITEEEIGNMVKECCTYNRHIGGCCDSFRKECCRKKSHFGGGFGGGGLSEIVIE